MALPKIYRLLIGAKCSGKLMIVRNLHFIMKTYTSEAGLEWMNLKENGMLFLEHILERI